MGAPLAMMIFIEGCVQLGDLRVRGLWLASVSWIMKSPPSISDRKKSPTSGLGTMVYYRNEMCG